MELSCCTCKFAPGGNIDHRPQYQFDDKKKHHKSCTEHSEKPQSHELRKLYLGEDGAELGQLLSDLCVLGLVLRSEQRSCVTQQHRVIQQLHKVRANEERQHSVRIRVKLAFLTYQSAWPGTTRH
jgi:hypothetical protein